MIWGDGYIAELSFSPEYTITSCWNIRITDAKNGTFTCFVLCQSDTREEIKLQVHTEAL